MGKPPLVCRESHPIKMVVFRKVRILMIIINTKMQTFAILILRKVYGVLYYRKVQSRVPFGGI